MKIKPVWGRVLVEPHDITETDPDLKRARAIGLEIAGVEKQLEQWAQMEGTLVEVGGNAFDTWLGTAIPRPGDRVLFNRHAGCTKEVEGKTYRLISDTDVLAIMEDENNE